jgi:asparagine synthase (glutamine-hydrolysing)
MTNDLVRKSLLNTLKFSSLSHEGLSGGFFMHERLPLNAADFYYLNEESGLQVLLSGAVYNRAELLPLCGAGPEASDPELIARLFMRDGPAFCRRLNGDFAIFIAEPGSKGAYLFRDHVGIRPLAYTMDGDTLIFSSDITGLSCAVSGGEEPDREYLMSPFRFTDRRKAPDARVKKMPPGHYLHFTPEGITLTCYWEPEKIKTDRRMKYDIMLSELRDIVHDAVAARCDRRFIAGAHVSNGIDSAVVATLARKEYIHQDLFHGFSWSPLLFTADGIKYDERELVRRLCEHAGIVPVFSVMSSPGFARHVSDYFYNNGHFPEENTLLQAAERGVNLLFSGWGGDEFISTGDRGIESDLLRGLHLGTFFRRSRIRHPRLFIRDMFYYVINPALGILDRRVARSFRDDARYLKKNYRKSSRREVRNFYFHTSRRQAHLRLLRLYHLQERCESWAVNGYRNGIEYRYPLLDRRIIEYMIRMPSELLCVPRLYRPLLRLIGEGVLPDEIRNHTGKDDPVYWAYLQHLWGESANRFMDEIKAWKANRALHFVDFDLLDRDIAKRKAGSSDVDDKFLSRALVYIKAIHEFIIKYRENE